MSNQGSLRRGGATENRELEAATATRNLSSQGPLRRDGATEKRELEAATASPGRGVGGLRGDNPPR